MVSNRKIIKKGVPFIKEPVLENVAVDIQQVEKDQLKKKKIHKGQILMAICSGERISKTASLLGCSQSAVCIIHQK